MSKLKLVIFDCDGVLFDSREANRFYYNRILEQFGHPPMDDEELEYVHSHNVMDSIDYIFRKYSPEEIEKAHTYRKAVDYAPYLKHMIMEPDLLEFLEFLKPAHHTAISTNRTTTMPAVLKIFGLEGKFEKVVTALDVENPKPHPEALVDILSHFDLSVEEAVFIGDSMVDQEHAAGIGMRLIAFKSPDLSADYHVSSFMEIAGLPIFSRN